MKSGQERDDYGPKSLERSPHFFKIVLDSAIQEAKLRIPTDFVIKHGKSLSDHVSLKVPNAGVWRVELMKMEGNVWLQKGWPKFANFYSVSYGYLLVFRYDGNSNFHVLIFRPTAIEIDYPIPPEPTVELEKDDVSIEILGEFPTNRKRKREAPKQRSMARKLRSKGNEIGGGVTSGLMATTRFGTRRPSNSEVTAIQRAKAFQSENPFFFVVMPPTYVSANYMVLPTSFVKKHLAEKKVTMVTLCELNGKRWKVNCCGRKAGSMVRATFCAGWKAFATATDLRVGDVCVFELFKQTEMLFKVFIFTTTPR